MANYEIVGIDVGNGYTKTVQSAFVSSVKDLGTDKPSIIEKTVMYNGRYYTVGGRRTKTKTDDKSENDETNFILALAGLGEEFKHRNITPDTVIISEGLPIERCGEYNRRFDEKYYKKGETVYFEYEDQPYLITIKDVIVSPQCLSGVIDIISTLPEVCILIDVGSWTIDILPVVDGKPSNGESKSLNDGVITCMLKCNEEIRRLTGREVLEEQIQKIMRGQSGVLPPKYEDIIKDTIRKYVKNIYDTLIENKHNVDTLPCIFLGGGATVVQNFGAELFPLARFYTDIHANAKGYEKIAAIQLKKRGA